MNRHELDPYPIPKEKKPLFINEPWIIDKSLLEYPAHPEPEEEEDNVRVYVPMDLNRNAILRRIDRVISQFGEANEENESEYYVEVGQILNQVEIYDQIWYARNTPEKGKHSAEAVTLVKELVEKLEDIPDGCAECFPFETIEELRVEYLK